jgi:hypothetical protein
MFMQRLKARSKRLQGRSDVRGVRPAQRVDAKRLSLGFKAFENHRIG